MYLFKMKFDHFFLIFKWKYFMKDCFVNKIRHAGIINFYITNLLYTKTSQYFKFIILYKIVHFEN